tara:strand:+ start:168 stop:647 length:480 start_codon:yes stop_codon:yes gene_type:complete
MIKLISKKNFYLFVTILSIVTLVGAVYIEYILNAKPCKLCLYQRYPYIAAIFVSFFGYYKYNNKFILYFLTFIFFISLIISGYHVGIEKSFFLDFSGCVSENTNTLVKEDLLNNLSEIPNNCKDVYFTILGLSLATINALMSLLIVIISVLLITYEKNR